MQHQPIHSGDLVKPSHSHRYLANRNVDGLIGIVVNIERALRIRYFTVLWSDGSLHMYRARNLKVIS